MEKENNTNYKKPCYIIAEAGLNHNGSLELAKKMIDVASEAQVDAVKFQKRDVTSLATGSELDSEDNRFPSLGRTYRQIRERLEFSKEEYQQLKSYAESKNLDFICTTFDIPSVDFLEEIGLKCYKIASHSTTNLPLLEYVASKNKKVILSTGMCCMDEIDQAVDILRKGSKELILLHCVSSYPQSLEESNLSFINVLQKRFGLAVGYSGHEIEYLPTLAAVSMGAVVIERHFTLDKNMDGFDHKISLEPQELMSMVRDIRAIEKTLGTGVKEITETEWVTRKKYHVSMVTTLEIPKGAEITREMITYKNPGTGIQPKDAEKIIGRKAMQDIPCDSLIDYSKVSVLDETDMSESDVRSMDKKLSIAAICPVLREFDPNMMEPLVDELRGSGIVDWIFLVSELDSVERYCENSSIRFIRRPQSLMPENATIEDVLQFGLMEIEKRSFCPDLILYSDYRFRRRPENLFRNIIQNLHSKKMDTVFPATERYSNIWTKNENGKYVMVGNWLPHERCAPMYLAMNGLGTVTRSSFIRQGRLIGDKVGLVATKEYIEKQYSKRPSAEDPKLFK